MLAHGVKCALTGGGTGTLTIGSAASGFRSPASAFMAGVPFYGTIYEGTLDAPTKWESGWFSHDGSGSLVRHIRDCTYDGTTFDDTSPAAVDFGASANVICTQPPKGVLPTRFLTGNALNGNNDYGTSGANLSQTTTSSTGAANKVNIQQVVFETGFTLSQMGVEVTTAAAAGKVCKMALCAPSADDGDPGVIIAAVNNIAVSSTGFCLGSVTPIFIPAGWYWVLMGFDAAPVMRGSLNQRRVPSVVATFGNGAAAYSRNIITTGPVDFVVGNDWWAGQGTGTANTESVAPTPIFK